MLRTCNGEDPSLVGVGGGPCACGKTFDDVYHLVIFPHVRFEKISTVEMDKIHDLYSKYVEDYNG